MAADPQNQQYGTGASLFGQDASAYASTNAPGSTGARTPPSDNATPPDMVTGLPGVGVEVPVDFIKDGAGASTHQPGQLDEGISGLGGSFTASTGAGLGSANHAPHPGSRP